ncbi:MAG TPA: hypothetical protein VMZ71_06855 [Gemmataceae bacterium]|nr:hypothetical protein [Gemmataceae bacterium]
MPTSLIDRIRAADPERHARRLAPAGAVLCLAGAALANAFGVVLALLGLALLLVSCLSRDDGLLVLGPFARYELHRMAHHRRPPAFWRALYAAAVGVVLIGNVWSYLPHTLGLNANLRADDLVRMQYVGQQVFNWIATVQFLYLSYLTVALLAPLVAEEREAKRLDFLFVTDLRNREILLGKALGRAPQLLDPILASLPVLAVLPLLGGVPPAFVVAAAGATLATVLGLAGLSFFCSIVSQTGRAAVSMVWGLCFAYFMFSGVLWGLALKPQAWTFPTSVGLNLPVEVGDLVIAASAGNPVVGMVRMSEDIKAGADTETRVLNAVRSYTLFQMGAFACFGLMAVSRLRQAKVVEPSPRPLVIGAKHGDKAAPFVRPPVTDDPVSWHERHRETKLRTLPEPWSNARWQLLAGIAFVIVAHVMQAVIPRAEEQLAKAVVGVIVWGMGLVVLHTASGRAAATVAREREKDTLEGLMLTGLGCREILRQKWLGCVTAIAPVYVVMLGAMAAGVVTGVMHPASAVLVALTVPVHAALAAGLGLVFSVRAKNPARAGWLMWMTVIGVVWLASIPIGACLSRTHAGAGFQAPLLVALIPPGATGAMLMAFEPAVLQPSRPWEAIALITGAVGGTVFYGFVARWLWLLAVRRLESEWERWLEVRQSTHSLGVAMKRLERQWEDGD